MAKGSGRTVQFEDDVESPRPHRPQRRGAPPGVAPQSSSPSPRTPNANANVTPANLEEIDNKVFWPAQLYIFVYFLVPLVLEVIVYAGDVGSDLVVAGLLFSHGLVVPGLVTLLLMYLPPIVALVAIVASICRGSEAERKRAVKEACVYLVLLAFFPIWPLYRYVCLLPYAWNALWTKEGREENLQTISEQTDVSKYRFNQAFLQAAPQFLFQAFLLLLDTNFHHHHDLVGPQVYCMIFSTLSMTLVTVKYQNRTASRPKLRKVRRNLTPAQHLSSDPSADDTTENDASLSDPRDLDGIDEEEIIEVSLYSENMATALMYFFGWVFIISGRVFALALLAAKLYYVFILLVVAHIGAFTAYYVRVNDVDWDWGRLGSIAFNGFVLIFCVVNHSVQFSEELGLKPTVFYPLYFGLMFLEDIAIVVTWFVSSHSQVWFHDFGLGYSITSYVFGVSLLGNRVTKAWSHLLLESLDPLGLLDRLDSVRLSFGRRLFQTSF
ncbi:unnamed protein product [Notodromas monacha]|uniref:XK-related protein n=1 Tax=Notodromas monacha TaxID=399045 RepID=A0A7R9BKM0_9CRUS|nr:unnamed protein product [Notodromas monacha]CAG0915882.1 unnamed protein product [Notodromas monacha]